MYSDLSYAALPLLSPQKNIAELVNKVKTIVTRIYNILFWDILKRDIYYLLEGLIVKSIHDEKYIEIITRLRIARIEKNITQNALSKTLGVPQSFISKVECCDRRLDVVEFINWLNALKLSIDVVMPMHIEQGEK